MPARRGRTGRDEYTSRPRFLAISEFGPRALIYHEGARYRAYKVNLDFGSEAIEDTHHLATQTMKRCSRCGYTHLEAGGPNLAEMCDRCGAALDATSRIDGLVQLQNVSLRLAQRITCDEEERRRFGYDLVTAWRFPEVDGRLDRGDAEVLCDGVPVPVLGLSYGDATDLWRVVRVVPFVKDTKNALVMRFEPPRSGPETASLQAAFKQAIQQHFQLDKSALGVTVAVPGSSERIAETLFEGALFRERAGADVRQLASDFIDEIDAVPNRGRSRGASRLDMDGFDLGNRLVSDYRSYTHSFIRIRDPRIETFVEGILGAEGFWPESLLQLNPTFRPGGTIDDLVASGILHPQCARIFRIDKSDADHRGKPLLLHRHQREAILKTREGRSYVLTTGTGSGKSLAWIVPIVDHVLRRRSGRGIQAIVVYPMNALANSQSEELGKFIDRGCPQGRSLVRFARYTGQERGPERDAIRDSPPDILLTNYMMLELLLTRILGWQTSDRPGYHF